MADQGLVEAFNDCIDRMASGQSITDCLRHYPQYAAALRPMLELGGLIDRAQPAPFEVATAQNRVRARVSQRVRIPPHTRRSYARFGLLVASLLIALTVLFGLAENSLPGDSLYGVKRFTENVRSGITSEQFGERRLDEIRVLISLKRQAEVEFTGQVEQIDAQRWHVAGLDLQVGAGTPGAESLNVGDTIHVIAITTGAGDLIAQEVALLEKGLPPPTAAPSTTPTPSPAPTNTPAPSLTSTALPTPTETPTSTLMSTPATTPTVCATVVPAGWVRYLVQPNDTVAGLAVTSSVSVAQLMAVNCLPQTQMIIVGQTLFLPSLPPTVSTPTQPVDQTIAQPTIDNAQGGNDHGGTQNGGDGSGSKGSGSSDSASHSGSDG